MKKLKLTGIFLIFSVLVLSAQGVQDKRTGKNTIHLEFGASQGYFKDLNFSPLNYSAKGLTVDLGYQRRLQNDDRIFFYINGLLGELNSAVSELFTSAHYNFNVELGYLKNIPTKFSKIKIGLGGEYHPYLDLVFHGETDAKTFFGLHSLDLTGSITWDISTRHSLNSTLSLPVFGLLIRPPWTGWDQFITEPQTSSVLIFFTGNWTSLNDFFAFNWNLQYHFAISRNWELTATYQFRYYRTDKLHTSIIPSNIFTLGTCFSF